MDKKSINFILENDGADTAKLLFSMSKESAPDIRRLVSCIEARKKIKNKVPRWFETPSLLYPSSLPLEQCSSQQTAIYKTRFISPGDKVADLTGGLGIDTYFFSTKASKVDYFERSEELCKLALYNFNELNQDNIFVNNININISSIENIQDRHYNLIFLDPARRDSKGGKIADLTQCEPNVIELKESIFTLTDTILLKLSPMEDLLAALKLLPETVEAHIISVKNDCKEMLLLLSKGTKREADEIKIYCVNDLTTFVFTKKEELEAQAHYSELTDNPTGYLYEPYSSIMKASPLKLLTERYPVTRLNSITSLYLSDSPIVDFPGKMFKILEMVPFKKSNYQYLSTKYAHGSVTAKNLPMTSEEIRKLLKLDDGDKYHLFAFEHGDRSRFRSERFIIVTAPIRER